MFHVFQSDEATLHSAAVLQQFTIPSANNLIGLYSTTHLSHDLLSKSHDTNARSHGLIPDYSLTFGSYEKHPDLQNPLLASHDSQLGSHDPVPTSSLGGCVIVTSTSVYQCRQKRSPEALFHELALNPKTQEKAENFGITYKLDVCGLYKVRNTYILIGTMY